MDDPFFIYLFPSDRERKRALPAIYRGVLSWMLATGDIYATSENMEGVFVIRRPGTRHSPLSIVRAWAASLRGILVLPFQVSISGLFRRSRSLRPATRTLFDCYRRFEPSIHLNMIAVDRRYRGQKLMSAMMRAILADAGHIGAYCVLDTENEENIPVYQHLGFRKAHEIVAVPGKVTYYLMVYEPGLTHGPS